MNRNARILAILLIFLFLVASTRDLVHPATAAADPVLVGAGDIASCDETSPAETRAEATAKLLDALPEATIFTTGDNAYSSGTEAQFRECYDPTWGRHKARTYPSPGNHDYNTAGAAPYYAYFGANAGPAGKGYYSYDLGEWHVISLNSNIDADDQSAQAEWLRADLAANPASCTLAYWHHPVFSSGDHGNDSQMADVLRILYEQGADVVLNGHDHNYERFAPQNPDGEADARGIREFVVGTGGTPNLRSFGAIQKNSEVRDSKTFGVLKLTLHPTSYDWEFVPVAGQTFRDSGSAACVGTTLPTTATATSAPGSTPSATAAPTSGPGGSRTVVASVETEPVPHSGDAADDAAIWVHDADPAQSTIIGTDKQGGLAVYDLAGRQIQYLPDGRLNNVDLRAGWPLGGQPITLVTAGNRTNNTIAIYRVDPASRRLENVAARPIRTLTTYGSCMYRSPRTNRLYYFVNSEQGEVEQWELFDTGSGKVDARLVRSFDVGSQTEGCVADDELGHLYIGEEAVGIWKYSAEPDAGTARTAVDTTEDGHLVADVEGLTIAYGHNGTGYLIASNQGDDNFVVYAREGNNAYLTTFAIVDGNGIDGVSDTDGIDVAVADLGPAFPNGVFVAQDGRNDDGNQNFKLVPLERILGGGTSGGDPTATPRPTNEPTATIVPATPGGATATTLPTAPPGTVTATSAPTDGPATATATAHPTMPPTDLPACTDVTSTYGLEIAPNEEEPHQIVAYLRNERRESLWLVESTLAWRSELPSLYLDRQMWDDRLYAVQNVPASPSHMTIRPPREFGPYWPGKWHYAWSAWFEGIPLTQPLSGAFQVQLIFDNARGEQCAYITTASSFDGSLPSPTALPTQPTVQPTTSTPAPTSTTVGSPTTTPTAMATAQPSATSAPTTPPGSPTATATPLPPQPGTGGDGLWISPAELAQLPMAGPAWTQLKTTADGNLGTAKISDQDSNHDVKTLAVALVYARTGDPAYRAKAAEAIMAAIGTEAGGRTLALGRNLPSYVIAADLIDLRDYDVANDQQFRNWLRDVRHATLSGRTLISTHEDRPNNWGTHAGAARIAADMYLGDTTDLARAAQVFKGWLGDRSAYAGFKYGDLSWQADPSAPVGVNPAGATKNGHSIDGVFPDDMRRGNCGFRWPPCHTGYAWGAMEGAVVQAGLLARAGYDAWNWEDKALLRAAQFLHNLDREFGGWWAEGDDEWQPWIINKAYGANFSATAPARHGKNMGWTDWTHAR